MVRGRWRITFDVEPEKIPIKLEHVNQPDQNYFTILGIAEPFEQGGSWRITLPKRYVKKYDIAWKCKGKQYFGLVFVETAKGVLLVETDEIINPEIVLSKVYCVIR